MVEISSIYAPNPRDGWIRGDGSIQANLGGLLITLANLKDAVLISGS